MEKSQERLAVLEKITEYEKNGWFDKDVENDPPGRQIQPGEIDYLRKKLSSKIKTRYAYFLARKFYNKILREGIMVIDGIEGLENFADLKSGAVVTCNHFNAMDSFALQYLYEASKHKKRKFYKVIKEGNYTSFPGFYGQLMRNCYTLPLSSNTQTLKEFVTAVNTLLRRGNFVLVYPEQSMWWNYRKPKPLKRSAFKFAAENDVPVLPVFITMRDTDNLDNDGFPVQAYTIHVGKPIYRDVDLSDMENAENMKKRNYEVWKEIYEKVYGIPLEYERK